MIPPHPLRKRQRMHLGKFNYLVVYTLTGCAMSMAAKTSTCDYFCHAESYDDAKEIYDDLSKYGENLYHASITQVLESTDYGLGEPETKINL